MEPTRIVVAPVVERGSTATIDDDAPTFLLNHVAGRAERLRALAVLMMSAAVFCALAPFAAFIPIYESALVITDAITGALLFGQYRILHTPALAILASGYLFTALTAVGQHGISTLFNSRCDFGRKGGAGAST